MGGGTWEHGGASGRLADTSSPGRAFLPQLVYLMKNQQGQLVKRHVPVEQLLMYQQLSNHYFFKRQG